MRLKTDIQTHVQVWTIFHHHHLPLDILFLENIHIKPTKARTGHYKNKPIPTIVNTINDSKLYNQIPPLFVPPLLCSYKGFV